MLTPRAWWFLLMVFTLLVVGVVVEVPARTPMRPVTLLGLTLLLWFTAEWLLFSIRSGLVVRGVTLEREVRDERGPVDTLWAGRPFHVSVRLSLSSIWGLPYVAVADRVPFGLEQTEGDSQGEGVLSSSESIELKYRIRAGSVGRVRFEGVRLDMADLQGFFYHATFIPGLVRMRVRPVLGDENGPTPTSKRVNLLPPPGVHRLHRPGSGSELLDLRDYMPGDPPKTIAWKVSARRDRLITKEFESEVPLRCTLLVDTSNSVRVGPPGRNTLTRLIEIAAAAAQANAAARDMTGLCLFDEHHATHVRPARTARHLAELLNRLTDAAGLAPTEGRARVDHLMPLGYAFAQEVYPELMRPEVNRFPGWLPWLWPRPAWSVRNPTWDDRYYGGLRLLFRSALVLVLLIVLFAAPMLYLEFPPEFIGLFAAALAIPALIVLLVWFVHNLFFGARRLAEARRKRLSALLSVQYDLGPGGIEALAQDDDHFSLMLQRFLSDHNVPYVLPLYDEQGRYAFRSPGKIEVLSKALLGLVGRGHDNEFFVILADLFELDEELSPLLKAVRVALARHHQVVIVCPWIGTPEDKATTADRAGLPALLDEATAARLRLAYQRVRHSFARMGVPVVSAGGTEPVGLILDRMDRLRMMGKRR